MLHNPIMSDEQQAIWNGPRAQKWVEEQELLDRLFKPFEDLLASTVSAGQRVLDVGCGTGATTLAIARRVGEHGRTVGIDISEPMLTLARQRAEREKSQARFIAANAETFEFEPASFDLVTSRFGVMFFNDPVRAFQNLRRAARELKMIAWRSAEENPFMTVAERAAAPFLPSLPPRDPNAPGQFAFGDAQRVRGILEQSGWEEIEIRPIDIACSFPASELERYFTKLGPLGVALHDADRETRAKIIEVVRAAFAPYIEGSEVKFLAACWLVSARSHP
jgi:SAM-dependent methyltransferase